MGNKISRSSPFQYEEDIPSHLQCLICIGLVEDPVRHGGADGCGRIYCRRCLSHNWTIDTRCPNCREDMPRLSIVSDPQAAHEIWIYKVEALKRMKGSERVECFNKCKKKNGTIRILYAKNMPKHLRSKCPRRPFKCPRCQESGEYQEMKAHHSEVCEMKRINCPYRGCHWRGAQKFIRSHIGVCDFTIVYCPNKCQSKGKAQKFLQREITSHLKICSRRKENCMDCGEEMEHRELFSNHSFSCPQALIECPNKGCEDVFPRFKTAEHRATCDCEPIRCKYARYGCKARPRRKDLARHEEDDLSRITLPPAWELSFMKEVRPTW